jgi:small subunit ribosomal protein S20
MAHSLSAKKRVRQNLTHRARNHWRIGRVKAAVKGFLASIHDGKTDEAQKQLTALYKLVDQIAATGSIHRNRAARYKSRLTTRLNAAKKPKAA